MPNPSLTALQRRAQQERTVDRAQATRLNQGGMPCLHAGHERYLPLDTAIRRLGVDDALTLSADKRSLLGWELYPQAALSALGLAIITVDALLTPAEYMAFTDRGLRVQDLHRLQLPEPRSGLAVSMQRLSAELDAALDRNAQGRHWVRTDQLRALFDTLMLAQAVLGLYRAGEDPGAGVTPERLRETLAQIITNPEGLIREARSAARRASGLPADQAEAWGGLGSLDVTPVQRLINGAFKNDGKAADEPERSP